MSERSDAYNAYLRSQEWAKRRKAALKRAGHRCQVCNRTLDLCVHHRTYARFGHEDPSDLTVLCACCHNLFHQVATLEGYRPPKGKVKVKAPTPEPERQSPPEPEHHEPRQWKANVMVKGRVMDMLERGPVHHRRILMRSGYEVDDTRMALRELCDEGHIARYRDATWHITTPVRRTG